MRVVDVLLGEAHRGADAPKQHFFRREDGVAVLVPAGCAEALALAVMDWSGGFRIGEVVVVVVERLSRRYTTCKTYDGGLG